MNWFFRTFSYSIGRKIIMSLTGLFLVTYLVEHLVGNFLLLAGDEGVMYNAYSHFMVNNPFIMVIEYVLFFCFIFHIIDGIYLWRRNRAARPQRYVMTTSSANSKWSSRNMIVSGTIVLIFLILHLAQFFWPYRITHTEHDLYARAVYLFEQPLYSLFYAFAMIFIGFHIHHGFSSAFQTIGIRHPKYYPFLKGLGIFLAFALAIGYAIIPLYFLIF